MTSARTRVTRPDSHVPHAVPHSSQFHRDEWETAPSQWATPWSQTATALPQNAVISTGGAAVVERPPHLVLALCIALSLCLTPILHAQAHRELHVLAASDLQPVMGTLADAFEHATGIHLIVSFGSSATLATQILNGDPADLFQRRSLRRTWPIRLRRSHTPAGRSSSTPSKTRRFSRLHRTRCWTNGLSGWRLRTSCTLRMGWRRRRRCGRCSSTTS